MRGKREMKRNYTPFVAGMVTMVLLIGLISASFAASEKAAGDNSGGGASEGAVPADVSIGVFLQQQIAPGEMLTTESGGKAPKVLAYADTKGETHYYIEAAAVAELFDVADGVNFHEEANQLEFGACGLDMDRDGKLEWDALTSRQRHDFNVFGSTDENGNMVISSEGFEVTGDNGAGASAFFDGRGSTLEDLKEMWARQKSILSAKPEYGKTLGMYTEVDPEEINLGSISGRSMDRKEFQDEYIVEHTFAFTSMLGKYAAITIENTGTAEANIHVDRMNTVGDGGSAFTGIYLPAGAKITRAFRIDESKPVENLLRLTAKPLGEGGVSVKLTAEQYRSGK